MVSRFFRLLALGTLFALTAIVGLAFSQGSTSPNLIITSPAADTLVHPGDNVQVKVAATRNYVAVYLVGDSPIGVSMQALRTAPSYSLSIHIPHSIAPGSYRITAMGAIADGPSDMSAPVMLDVEN